MYFLEVYSSTKERDKMILRIALREYKFICSFRKTSRVLGVISRLNGDNNEHILMWDFDNKFIEDVALSLKIIQMRYFLSDIMILESNKEKQNYHAYCFTRTDWQKAVAITASTPNIDWDFVRLAVYRGNFTLRISQKLGNPEPNLVRILKGETLADCTPEDLISFVNYEIWRDKEKIK